MKIAGNGVSEGLAIGPVYVYHPFSAELKEENITPEETEQSVEIYEKAVEAAARELAEIRDKLRGDDPKRAEIFAAHQDVLADEAVKEEIIAHIREDLWSPAWAVGDVYKKFIIMLRGAPDPLISERAADLEDVRGRLLRVLAGEPERNLSILEQPVVIVARDLFPSDTATIDRKNVLAILTEAGGSTSHSAIIARGFEIPAVVGIADLMQSVQDGQIVAVDAINGVVEVDPDESDSAAFRERVTLYGEKREETRAYIGAVSATVDGVKLDIGLNIGSADAVEMEGERFTDFVGLFRTEFLYMGRHELPSEEEQLGIYKKVLQAYGQKPVVLRTLDIGGDKPLLCLNLPSEENPFLGNRALRLCFSRVDIFKTQLRAALAASVYGNLQLMLPMVASIDDIRRAKGVIEDVKKELQAEGIAYREDVPVGVMVEIPSIALIADHLVKEVDFISFGTNDLCQYLTATDRMNPRVACYYQTYHPALFRLIALVTDQFVTAGKPVSVCGEMAGDLTAAAALIGIGVRKLSMGFSSIAKIKRMLSYLRTADAEEMAEQALELATAGEVEAFLKKRLRELSPAD